jgi:dTDP-4-dehydrorhamnose 3,5-epimerase
MSRLTIIDTPISGVKVIERQLLGDQRGHFARIFCADDLGQAGWPGPIAQVNESFTVRAGSLRGMHYQGSPFADWKLVTCVRGAVIDIALDIRAGSSTVMRWHGERLSADNGHALLIPPGCAHGFQALTADVSLVYCHSRCYTPEADSGISPLDPLVAIEWPLPIADMSDRDRTRPMLPNDFAGVQF